MQIRNKEPIIKKFPTEIFGFPYTDTSPNTQKIRSEQHCPYLNGECQKPRKSEPTIKIGDCSTGYQGEFLTKFEPVIICPHRFKESGVWEQIKQNVYGDFPKERIEVVPEVSMGSAGSVDYVLIKARAGNEEIEDFVCVEFQAAGTTGTPWDAIQEFRENGHFSRDSYDFGINWANEFLKTMMQQAYKKGIIIESWGKKIIFVIQDVGLKYLKAACDTSDLRNTNDQDPIHFYTFKMVWQENNGRWTLQFDEKLSTDTEGIRKMLSGTTAEDHPTKETFIQNIKNKRTTRPDQELSEFF